MATRQETQHKRAQLARELRLARSEGRLRAGDPIPPQRELADRYGLSMTVVGQEVRKLVEQGTFYAVHRVGTFVGPPPTEGQSGANKRDLYLMLADLDDGWWHIPQIRLGFEDRIAHLGGAVATLDLEQARAYRQSGHGAGVAGVFELSATLGLGDDAKVARVVYGEIHPWSAGADVLSFDDFDGGEQATQCLLETGARKLAFVGLHRHGATLDDWPEWSLERCQGFQSALVEAGLNIETTFHPRHGEPEFSGAAQKRLATDAARQFISALQSGVECDGVVAANSDVARAILSELQGSSLSHRQWPAIVGFDSDPTLRDQLLTSLRLSWDEVGRRAADLLWERRNGRLPAAPQHVAVKMRLISRLSCQPQWMSQSHFDAPALAL